MSPDRDRAGPGATTSLAPSPPPVSPWGQQLTSVTRPVMDDGWKVSEEGTGPLVASPMERRPSLVPPEKGPTPGVSIPEVRQRVPAACGLGVLLHKRDACAHMSERAAEHRTLGAARLSEGRQEDNDTRLVQKRGPRASALTPDLDPDPGMSLSPVGLTPLSNKHLLSAGLSSLVQ